MQRTIARGTMARGWRVAALLMVVLAVSGCGGTGGGNAAGTGSGTPGSTSGPGGGVEIASFESASAPSLQFNARGQLVWAATAPDARPVYVYEQGTSRQISDAGEYCICPQIGGGGAVVWSQFVQGSREQYQVYLSDGTATRQLSTGNGSHLFPAVNGRGEVAWQYRADNQADWDLLYHDPATGATTNLSPPDGLVEAVPTLGDGGHLLVQRQADAAANSMTANLLTPRTSAAWDTLGTVPTKFVDDLFEKGEYQTWRKVNTGGATVRETEDDRVVLRDGANERILASRPATRDHACSEINDQGQVVFEAFDGTASQIYFYDGSTVQKLTEGASHHRKPHLNRSGQIVWQTGAGAVHQVHVYDQGIVRQVSTGGYDHVMPQIADNGDIAWVARDRQHTPRYRKLYLAPASPVATVETVTLASAAPANDDVAVPSTPPVEPGATGAGSTKFSFIVFGDSRGSDASVVLPINQANWDFLRYMVNGVNNEFKPDFMVFLGDMTTRGSAFGHSLTSDWLDVFAPLKTQNKLYVAKGNHELYGTVFVGPTCYRYSNQVTFQDLFNFLPTNGSPGYTYLDYSFVYGNSCFMFLDAFYCQDRWSWETLGDVGNYGDLTPTQAAWARSQLQSTTVNTATHRFALSHAPLFSDEGVPATANLVSLAQGIDQKCFDFFFGAHEHLYSRKILQGKVDPTIEARFVNNVVQVVAGAGGAGTDSAKDVVVKPEDGWNVQLVQHFVVVDVDGDVVRTRAYQVLEGDNGYYHAAAPFDVVTKQGTTVTIGP